MKRIWLFVIILLTTICCTACIFDMSIFKKSNEEIADETFSIVIEAIKSKDQTKLLELFSETVQNEVYDLEENALEFFEFIEGDILSFSKAMELGMITHDSVDYGKRKKEIESRFNLTTTEHIYYFDIKECTRDDYNDDNVGIVSMYVIGSENWGKDYVYRGNAEWTPGINIVQ